MPPKCKIIFVVLTKFTAEFDFSLLLPIKFSAITKVVHLRARISDSWKSNNLKESNKENDVIYMKP